MQNTKQIEHRIITRKIEQIEEAIKLKFKELTNVKERLIRLETKIDKLQKINDTKTHILIDKTDNRIDYSKYLELFESLKFKKIHHKKTHQFVLWLFLYQNGYLLREIAEMFNKKDHSTIIHGRNMAMNNILSMPKAYESECKFYNDLLNLKKEQNDTEH